MGRRLGRPGAPVVLAHQGISSGLADQEGLAAIADGWRHWAGQAAGFFTVVHGEVLARRWPRR